MVIVTAHPHTRSRHPRPVQPVISKRLPTAPSLFGLRQVWQGKLAAKSNTSALRVAMAGTDLDRRWQMECPVTMPTTIRTAIAAVTIAATALTDDQVLVPTVVPALTRLQNNSVKQRLPRQMSPLVAMRVQMLTPVPILRTPPLSRDQRQTKNVFHWPP